MDNEQQNLLSKDKQAKLETLKTLLSAEFSLLQVRSSILPTVATLSATLLVVATFNDRLLPVTNGVRYMLVSLLILIPISLIVSFSEIRDGFRIINEEKKKAMGKNVIEQKTGKFYSWLIYYFPFIGIIWLSIIISIIIYLIIKHADPC